jgi:hypothetical protein
VQERRARKPWGRAFAPFAFVATTTLCMDCSRPAPSFDSLYVLPLHEAVFAYARISPNGDALVFSSIPDSEKMSDQPSYQLKVIDLKSRATLYATRGIDGWWSNSGDRLIYRDQGSPDSDVVSIWHRSTGAVVRNVAPLKFGDYFSWATREGQDLIVTIANRFYNLDGDRARLPESVVQPCPGIGAGDRPLVSRDGMRITTFMRGTIVVRNLTDCNFTFDTGISGAKADFSWDGRYIAFHAQKTKSPSEYEIDIVDIKEHTIRRLTSQMPGSSLFPSWTRDGRVCFRYKAPNFDGFLIASNVLGAPPEPLPRADHRTSELGWDDVFPETRSPTHSLNIVLVWSTWSAHSAMALVAAQRARDWFRGQRIDVGIAVATDPASDSIVATRMLRHLGISLDRVSLNSRRLNLTGATNQVPVALLFSGDTLIDRRLGALTSSQLQTWVAHAVGKTR